jgi:hypothetical protein
VNSQKPDGNDERSDSKLRHRSLQQRGDGISLKSRPRKTLGVLESTALFCIAARTLADLDTTAADLLAEFARFEKRDVSASGLYLLLDSLERKDLLERAVTVGMDALGRQREVRSYQVTHLGRQLAKAEYDAQLLIIERARMAFV